MAFINDYTNELTILIPHSEHLMDFFPIIQIYQKIGNDYVLQSTNIVKATVFANKDIQLEFAKGIEIRVVMK